MVMRLIIIIMTAQRLKKIIKIKFFREKINYYMNNRNEININEINYYCYIIEFLFNEEKC